LRHFAYTQPKEKYIQMIQKFKKIIEFETGVNVEIVSRKRNFVEARAIYYKLLRDISGMTLHAIGDTVNKDHATILHSLKSVDDWMRYDTKLADKYKNILYAIDNVDDTDFNSLRYENMMLKLRIEEFEKRIKKLSNNRLYSLMDKIPYEKEEAVYDRLSVIVRMNC
jgi:hypothetical protein